VFLAYRLPREPSTPRITLWRKLRRLGAEQVLDGLAALPLDARTKEQLEWLADEVVEAGGDATLWIAEASSARQERELIASFKSRAAEDYAAVLEEVRALGGVAPARTIARLRRELHRIGRRDFFPPPEREHAQREVEELAAQSEEATR
jgi:hypothetical protein